VREHEQTARRTLATVAMLVGVLGFAIIDAALTDLQWSVYSQVNGTGRFGLWKYEFTIYNVSRSGDIQSHEATALCNLDYYNATRAREKEHDKVPGRWKDDCDDMLDACGLAKGLGIVAGIASFFSAVLAGISGFVKVDDPKLDVGATFRQRVCPSFSAGAFNLSAISAVTAALAVLAYASERPYSPNKFLKDYDTPGHNRTWSLGQGFYLMVAGCLIMVAAGLVLLTVKNSKKIFLTSNKGISSTLLAEDQEKEGLMDYEGNSASQQQQMQQQRDDGYTAASELPAL